MAKKMTAAEKAARAAERAALKAWASRIESERDAKRAELFAKIEAETAKAVEEVSREIQRTEYAPSRGAAAAVERKAQIIATRLSPFLFAAGTPEAAEAKTAISRRIAAGLRQKIIETKRGPAIVSVEAPPSGRDARRAEFSEAAEKRQAREASSIVRSIDKKIGKAVQKQLGKRPNAGRYPESAADWDKQFDTLKKAEWRRVASSRTLPMSKEQVARANELIRKGAAPPTAIAQVLTEVRDRPIGLIPVGKSKLTGKTIFALPNLPPIEFTNIYLKSPPKKGAFTPTPNDPAVKALVAGGTSLSEAVDQVRDAQHKIAMEQWEAVTKAHRADPVYIEIIDPKDPNFVARPPFPNRAEFGFEAGGRERYEAAVAAWMKLGTEKQVLTNRYTCKSCNSIVKTGSACSCKLYTKLKIRPRKKFPAFKAPSRHPDETEKTYEKRYDEAVNRYNAAQEKFEQRQLYEQVPANLPVERRIFDKIVSDVRKSMGPAPRSGADREMYFARANHMAMHELEKQLDARMQAVTPAMDSPAYWQYLKREAAQRQALAPLMEPGTVTVNAGSKEEAEAKATLIAARENKIDPDVIRVAGKSFSEARIEKLQKEAQKGRLSPAKQMELNRLLAASALSSEKKGGGVSGLGFGLGGGDIGGKITGLAIGGLIAFALFKAATSKPASQG